MFIDDTEFPVAFHPVTYVDGEPFMDTTVTWLGWQVRPLTRSKVASWSWGSGTPVDGQPGLQLPNGQLVGLGDFVMSRDGTFTVEAGDGFYQRWARA